MIEKLTPQQEARFPEFIKKWTDIGLSTERANRKEAEEGIKEAYKIAGLKTPKIVWCDSPLSHVWASVGASVGASVWASGYGQHEANWLAFYDFFKEACKLEQETNRLNGLWKIAKNAGWFLPHENICWISERPIALHRNARGQLHNENGMAIKYPDGWGVYSLNGVRFTEELYNKVISKEFSFADRMKIEDIDQRTQAINPKFCDLDAFIKEAKGELLDEVNKFDITGEPVNYKLYKFPQGEIFTEDAYYCLFDCPSTRKRHMEGVEKCKTVAEAQAWAMSDENIGLIVTPEDWKNLIPLQHET